MAVSTNDPTSKWTIRTGNPMLDAVIHNLLSAAFAFIVPLVWGMIAKDPSGSFLTFLNTHPYVWPIYTAAAMIVREFLKPFVSPNSPSAAPQVANRTGVHSN